VRGSHVGGRGGRTHCSTPYCMGCGGEMSRRVLDPNMGELVLRLLSPPTSRAAPGPAGRRFIWQLRLKESSRVRTTSAPRSSTSSMSRAAASLDHPSPPPHNHHHPSPAYEQAPTVPSNFPLARNPTYGVRKMFARIRTAPPGSAKRRCLPRGDCGRGKVPHTTNTTGRKPPTGISWHRGAGEGS